MRSLLPAVLCLVAITTIARASHRHSNEQGGQTGGLEASHPEVIVCTQNLWNYGLPAEVHALRRPGTPLATVRESVFRQEKALVSRMAECDLIAVQEVLGSDEASALSALERLGRLLERSSGHRYTARVAGSDEPIRNGFLFRTDSGASEVAFDGWRGAGEIAPIRGFPRARWGRAPAELLVGLRNGGRLRVISVHLKSKSSREGSGDPHGEKWERRRVVQAAAILKLARDRLRESPRELLLVAGDLNNGAGSATQAVASGEIDPVALLSPRDCIDAEGRIACALSSGAAALVNLTAGDPDLRGRGSYRFDGREEMIDAILASPEAARLALEPGQKDGDYDVRLVGRINQGSDHRLVEVRLRAQ